MNDDVFTAGLEPLKVGSDQYKNYLTTKEVEHDPGYEKGIPVGKVTRSSSSMWEEGDILRLRIQESDRMGIYGKTGSGKTWLIKTIISRAFQQQMKILHISDVKNDFADIDNKGGISKEDMKKSQGLLPDEKRTPLPKEMYMPKFLADEYRKSVPYYLNKFTYGLNDISISDFIALLQLSKRSHEETIKAVWNQLDTISYDGIYQALDEDEDLNTQLKKSIVSAIGNLEDQDVFRARYRTDPLQDLKENENVVALAMENWDNFKRGGLEKLEIYISITLRRMKNALRDGEILPPVVVIVDEAHAFVPNSGDSISREDIIDMIDLGRDYGVPMIFATQRPSQLPKEDVLEQQSYFLIDSNLPRSQRRTVLKEADLLRFGDVQRNKWVDIFNGMNKYEWLLVDREVGEWAVIDPLAPLCAHT